MKVAKTGLYPSQNISRINKSSTFR